MNLIDSTHPEAPLWSFLNHHQIPWCDSIDQLEQSFGPSVPFNHGNYIQLSSLPDTFKDFKIKVCAEVLNHPQRNYPPLRWLLKVDSPVCENSFQQLVDQCKSFLGKEKLTLTRNAKACEWQFEQAKMEIIYYFDHKDLAGNSPGPALILFVSPDFKPAVSTSEIEQLEQIDFIAPILLQNLKIVPLIGASNPHHRQNYKRLHEKFDGDYPLMGFNSQKDHFYAVQGFNFVCIPISELVSIMCIQKLTRYETSYHVTGLYLNGDPSLISGNHFEFATSRDSSASEAFATFLSQMSGLKLVMETQDFQY